MILFVSPPVRKAFTLLEVMVVIAIIGLMVSVGIASISAGKSAVRVKGATRDIYAAIRRARSTALVTGQPAVVTYSTVREDGEVMALVEISSAKLFDEGMDRSKMQTLSGEPLKGEKQEVVASSTEGETIATEGETIAEILFSPIDSEVVKGMRLKVVKGDEALSEADTGRKTKISVFSNVDYLIGRYKDAKAEAKKKEQEKAAASANDEAFLTEEEQESVSVVWETNGRVEPHQVWIYSDGQKPEDGLLIRIDRFGAAKVMGAGMRNE